MLWHCKYTWYPNTTRQQVAQRLVQQHEAKATHPDRWKGWYQLAGGGAGFLLIDTDDPRDLTALLQPYMDLMSFDVHAIYELKYDEMIKQLREVAQQRA